MGRDKYLEREPGGYHDDYDPAIGDPKKQKVE